MSDTYYGSEGVISLPTASCRIIYIILSMVDKPPNSDTNTSVFTHNLVKNKTNSDWTNRLKQNVMNLVSPFNVGKHMIEIHLKTCRVNK